MPSPSTASGRRWWCSGGHRGYWRYERSRLERSTAQKSLSLIMTNTVDETVSTSTHIFLITAAVNSYFSVPIHYVTSVTHVPLLVKTDVFTASYC